MGLYSEMLDEQRIKKNFQDAQKILMITCPGCACESLSYAKDLPCRSLEVGKDMEHSALAVHMVRDEWNERLVDMGKEVTHISIAFPCEMFDTDRNQISAQLTDHDTVAVLCCMSGCIAIKDMLPAFEGRIVPMMKTSGSFVFRLVRDETGKNSKVERETARIMRFGKREE